jgi:PIN domain nuclease of toxin-antitoxin system
VRLLLDTHIWLWTVADPSRLKPRVANALGNPANELWLSPVSTWELVLLVTKGRLQLDVEVDTWVRRALGEAAFREASLTHDVALRTAQMRLPHRDPADAWLAATAVVYDLTLVTADPRLIESRSCPILPNR